MKKYRKDVESFAIISDIDELVEKNKARSEVAKKLSAKKTLLEGQLVRKWVKHTFIKFISLSL